VPADLHHNLDFNIGSLDCSAASTRIHRIISHIAFNISPQARPGVLCTFPQPLFSQRLAFPSPFLSLPQLHPHAPRTKFRKELPAASEFAGSTLPFTILRQAKLSSSSAKASSIIMKVVTHPSHHSPPHLAPRHFVSTNKDEVFDHHHHPGPGLDPYHHRLNRQPPSARVPQSHDHRARLLL
jgi:hypothetical protein